MKNKLMSKAIMIPMLICSFVYGLALPFFWGNNPASETGTLSLLCEDRKAWFWLWAVLIGGGIVMNIQYMYKKFSYKNKLFDAMCILALLSVSGVALTLGHSIEDWNPKRLLHWICTGLFIVFLIAPIALFFIANRKKNKAFPILAVCTFLILATFGVIFGVVGKSAVMEMVPVAMMQIMLFVVNFTDAVKAERLQ